MLIILAPLCVSHGRAVYTCRTYEARLIFYTLGLVPGSAPQVSHERIWQYGRDLTHARVKIPNT